MAAGLLSPKDIGYNPTIKSADQIPVAGMLNTVYWAAGIVAVIVIVVAGIMMAVSNGDSQRVAQAKKAVLGATIGLVIVLFAFVITRFVIMRVAS